METIRLDTIAKVIGASYSGDIVIDNICTDTRKIEKGYLFIAFEGERFDAHSFAAQAAEAGAAALICSKPVECRAPVLYVQDTRKAYLDIAGYYRSRFHIPLVGITGSVGKTTTKEFVALALSAKYKTLKTQGNFNNDIGMPETLLRLDSSYEAAVIEMGMNHFGEIHALTTRSKPTIGVITNIGVSHIENLGSRDGILQAKLEILDGMEPDAPLILNGDDDKLSSVQIEGRSIYYFGIDNPKADFKAEQIKAGADTTAFTVRYNGGEEHIVIPTVGVHNVRNALCAFAVGVLCGIEPAAVAKKLAEYVPSGMRQKIVPCSTFTVIEDCYNASPDSMRAAIGTLAGMQATKHIAVLADMLELGEYSEQMHRDIGAYAAHNNIDVLLCYGEQAAYYCRQAQREHIKTAVHFDTPEQLLERLCEEINEGSAVLFKASHGMHLENIIKALYERKGIHHE